MNSERCGVTGLMGGAVQEMELGEVPGTKRECLLDKWEFSGELWIGTGQYLLLPVILSLG